MTPPLPWHVLECGRGVFVVASDRTEVCEVFGPDREALADQIIAGVTSGCGVDGHAAQRGKGVGPVAETLQVTQAPLVGAGKSAGVEPGELGSPAKEVRNPEHPAGIEPGHPLVTPAVDRALAVAVLALHHTLRFLDSKNVKATLAFLPAQDWGALGQVREELREALEMTKPELMGPPIVRCVPITTEPAEVRPGGLYAHYHWCSTCSRMYGCDAASCADTKNLQCVACAKAVAVDGRPVEPGTGALPGHTAAEATPPGRPSTAAPGMDGKFTDKELA